VKRRGSHNFLDNRLTDGGKVVSLRCRSPSLEVPSVEFKEKISIGLVLVLGHGRMDRRRRVGLAFT
jgi:hypothetical protein